MVPVTGAGPVATVARSTGPAAFHMCLYAVRIAAPHTFTALDVLGHEVSGNVEVVGGFVEN